MATSYIFLINTIVESKVAVFLQQEIEVDEL